MANQELSNTKIEKLYNHHVQGVRAFLFSKEKDASLVEDLLQDTFIKLLLSLGKGIEIRNPKSWLLRVAQNVLTDHYRDKRKEQHIPIESGSEQKSESHSPADCLHGLIASLPYKYKRAVYLTDIKGMRQTEAAEELKISLPTYKSHVQRGRNLVKQGYIDCCGYNIDENGCLHGETKNWEECKVCR